MSPFWLGVARLMVAEGGFSPVSPFSLNLDGARMWDGPRRDMDSEEGTEWVLAKKD